MQSYKIGMFSIFFQNLLTVLFSEVSLLLQGDCTQKCALPQSDISSTTPLPESEVTIFLTRSLFNFCARTDMVFTGTGGLYLQDSQKHVLKQKWHYSYGHGFKDFCTGDRVVTQHKDVISGRYCASGTREVVFMKQSAASLTGEWLPQRLGSTGSKEMQLVVWKQAQVCQCSCQGVGSWTSGVRVRGELGYRERRM